MSSIDSLFPASENSNIGRAGVPPAHKPDSDSLLSRERGACYKAAEIFKDIGLAKSGPEFKQLRQIWSNDLKRLIYFMLAGDPTSSQVAELAGITRGQASWHLSVLHECGLAKVNIRGKNHIYSPSLGPLLSALGESHAVLAVEDYFASACGIKVDRSYKPAPKLHETMYKIFDVLKSDRKLKIYNFLIAHTSKDQLFTRFELEHLLPDLDPRSFQREMLHLEKAGLLESHREKMQDANMYRANLSPLITVINDLNDTFGEGRVVDLTKTQEPFNIEQKGGMEKVTALFSALSLESRFDTLKAIAKKGPKVALRCIVERLGSSYSRQEEGRLAILRKAGLVNEFRPEKEVYLSVNWKPLDRAFHTLLNSRQAP